MNYRKVKFEYYQVVREKNGSEELFDLKEWMSEALSYSLEDRAEEYKSERARLEDAYFDQDFNFYFLHFVRLRATNIPSKAKLDTNVEPFELEDDEYLGEEVSALYDETEYTLMLQRNKFSLGPSGIEEYMNIIWNKEDEFIRLKPVFIPNSFKLARKPKVYRRLNLRIANLHKIPNGYLDKFKSPLRKIIDSYGEYNGVNAQITITVGSQKDLELDDEVVNQTLNDIELNQEIFAKAELAVKDHDEAPVEVIDLFDNNAHDFATFRMESRGTLNHFSVAEAMWRIYHPSNGNRQSEVSSFIKEI